jgi:threonine synthase
LPAASEAHLECPLCHTQYPLGPELYGCPACRSSGRVSALEMRYRTTREQLEDRSRPGIWRWRGLLPPVPESEIVSLGEGNTPLLRVRDWNGPPALYVKNETANPTWSYKDRAASVSITMARRFGYSRTLAISTGNLGNAVSAYSAAGGLECAIFCNSGAPDLQIALMEHYGSRVFRGGDQAQLARKLVARGGWYPATVICPRDGFANPYGIEGFKTIAFEIFEQLGGRVPDRVFAPAGSGDGLYGIWKGFVELHELGIANKRPGMIACQATGADGYVRAVRNHAPKLTELPSVSTIALSIAEKIGGELALGAIYSSRGTAIAVTDGEMMATVRALGKEGLALEPASAASVACAQAMAAQEAGNTGAGNTEKDEIWVAIGTGAAIKWPQDLVTGFRMPAALAPDYQDIDELIPITANSGS